MAIVICLIALAFISITMFARANDLKWDHCWHTHVRRVGLILTGCAPVGIAVALFKSPPTIYHCCFLLGLSLVFLTTPNQLPWWRFVSRGCHEQAPTP